MDILKCFIVLKNGIVNSFEKISSHSVRSVYIKMNYNSGSISGNVPNTNNANKTTCY